MGELFTGRGCGKFIVFGEHAVVYGRPALAASLPQGAVVQLRRAASPQWHAESPAGPLAPNDQVHRAVTALLDHFGLSLDNLAIDVGFDIPIGAGLGSSAALAVALARGAADLCGLTGDERQGRIESAVAASEAVFHGKASGIDQQAAYGGGFFRFQRRADGPLVEAIAAPPHRWYIAPVAPSASTADMVAGVADRRRESPTEFASYFDAIAEVTDAGQTALGRGDWQRLGQLMDRNQALLQSIGVSTPVLDKACEAARSAGALGAKLTGAGGGGCIVALADAETPMADALADFGPVYAFDLP